MGSVSSCQLADGTVKYRAEIRINRKGYPSFKESKTFTSRKIAKSWLVKREAEIEENPDILLKIKEVSTEYTLYQAIDKYLDDVEGVTAEAFMITLEQANHYVDYLTELLQLAEAAQARLFVVAEDFLKQGDAA